jgi:DNA (cytosine-5)-methyltransferase 1
MTHDTKYTDLSAEHQRYRGDIFDDKYNRLNENDLSRTITAHIAKDGYWYIHPRQSRTLTVREAARLQTFPDQFRFDGPPSAAFRQIGNAVPPQLGFVIGTGVLDSIERADDPGISTRQLSIELSSWFRQRSEVLTLPWLAATSRWEVVAGEVLLDRASTQVIRRLWPIIQKLAPTTKRRSVDADLLEGLIDMSRTVGRLNRADTIVALAQRIHEAPRILDGPAEEVKSATALPDSVIDLAALVVPGGSLGHEDEGLDEPVLVTKGVLRVARRFQANAVDRKNKMTDGRMAVARMIGFGPDARHAHLGLIELANSLCRPERPACEECPLNAHCARDGV